METLGNKDRFTLLESFLLQKIKAIEKKLELLATTKSEYSNLDYAAVFNRWSGQKDVLYECLTGYDNEYENPSVCTSAETNRTRSDEQKMTNLM